MEEAGRAWKEDKRMDDVCSILFGRFNLKKKKNSKFQILQPLFQFFLQDIEQQAPWYIQ